MFGSLRDLNARLFRILNFLFKKFTKALLISSPFYLDSPIVEIIEDNLIKYSKGIVHIGGHLGQEVHRYAKFDKSVIWIEANPEIFSKLSDNIVGFSNNVAYNYLLGNENKTDVQFYLANNNFASSSIFSLAKGNGFKKLKMLNTIKSDMVRMDLVFAKNSIPIGSHWILDVQGAELQVLMGSGDLIKNCQSLTVEVSTREVYDGAPSFLELNEFLLGQGFFPLWNPRKNSHENLIYVRKLLI